MTAQTYTVAQAVDVLTREGYAHADVLAALDSLITAGLQLDQPDPDMHVWVDPDGHVYRTDAAAAPVVLTADELDAVRDQLDQDDDQ